jgi:predicted AAA+ superfamily ATPase
MRQASDTLAGRVAYVNLGPIDALEFRPQIGDTNRLWLRGGFPESVLGFHSAREALKIKQSCLVHSGTEPWPASHGVTAIGLVVLKRKLAT